MLAIRLERDGGEEGPSPMVTRRDSTGNIKFLCNISDGRSLTMDMKGTPPVSMTENGSLRFLCEILNLDFQQNGHLTERVDSVRW